MLDSSEDIRNRKVINEHGNDIGHISGLFINKDERNRVLQVAAGGFLGPGERRVGSNRS